MILCILFDKCITNTNIKKNWNSIVLFSVDILLYTQVHLAGTVQKYDIQKYMWVYLNVLSRRIVHFPGEKSNPANTMSIWRHHVIPVKSHGFAVSLTILAMKSGSYADYVVSHAFQLKQNLQK